MSEIKYACACGWHLRWPGNVRLRYWPGLVRRHACVEHHSCRLPRQLQGSPFRWWRCPEYGHEWGLGKLPEDSR